MGVTFSIAMCTYNGAQFLEEQLASIAKQTRLPDELIVCDDCSTDSTVDVLRNFAAHAPFPVRLVVNKRNIGSTKNFEHAISLCGGEIIALSDQDDVWLPQKLRRLEEKFLTSPTTGLVFSDADVVDDKLSATGHRVWALINFSERHQQAISNGEALQVLLPGWFVTGATIAFRAVFRELALPIPTGLALIHDGWLAVVIASVADVALIPEPLILYRQHGGQQIGAPEAITFEDNSLRAALGRSNPYAQLLTIAEKLLERLTSQTKFQVAPAVLRNVRGQITHLKARESLSNRRFKRLPVVIGELLSGRYHRYSKGLVSAMKDLYGTNTPHGATLKE